MTDLAIDAYALFRRCYRQRTKPWEELATWEQEGWGEFFEAATRTITAAATAAERDRIRQLARETSAWVPGKKVGPMRSEPGRFFADLLEQP